MNVRPILFKPELVRAILAGQKWETRRIVRPQPQGWTPEPCYTEAQVEAAPRVGAVPSGPCGSWAWCVLGDQDFSEEIQCPYGTAGDGLWVREPWGRIEPYPTTMGDDDRLPVLDPSEWTPRLWDYWRRRIVYKADEAEEQEQHDRWRPSIHMPRWACRLVLPLVEVRVERLQEITEEGAKAEGVARDCEPCDHTRRSCGDVGCLGPGYRAPFAALWDKIYGRTVRASWAANPWVWVLQWDPQDILTGAAARPREVAA